MIDSLNNCLTAESAKRVLKFGEDAKLCKHLEQLADKFVEGTITPYESSEYEACVALADFVDMLKLKIRERRAKRSVPSARNRKRPGVTP